MAAGRRSLSKLLLSAQYDNCLKFQRRRLSTKPPFPPPHINTTGNRNSNVGEEDGDGDGDGVSGISRPISHILKELNKKVPDSLLKLRTEEPSGLSVKYIPWHIVNRIMNLHAPEWSGEVRSITYSADGKSVSVVYRVTLYGTDAEIFRESTGTASASETGYGDPVQKAEAMAFRRACARFGLGLHLYHEDME